MLLWFRVTVLSIAELMESINVQTARMRIENWFAAASAAVSAKLSPIFIHNSQYHRIVPLNYFPDNLNRTSIVILFLENPVSKRNKSQKLKPVDK